MLSITPIEVGKIKLCKASLTYNVDYDMQFWAPIFVYVLRKLEGNSKLVLVDAGFNPIRGSTDPARGGLGMFKAALRRAKIDAEQVDTLILTHLHNDHASFFELFPNATVFVQAAELSFAASPLPTQAMFYDSKTLRNLENVSLEIVKGDKRLDEDLQLVLVPGHTPGSQAVLVSTRNGIHAIAGDTVPMYHNWFPNNPQYGKPCDLPRIPPGINTSVKDWFESAVALEERTNYVVPSHDPLLRNLKVIP